MSPISDDLGSKSDNSQSIYLTIVNKKQVDLITPLCALAIKAQLLAICTNLANTILAEAKAQR